MRAVLILGLIAYAAAGAVELDASNFEAEARSSSSQQLFCDRICTICPRTCSLMACLFDSFLPQAIDSGKSAFVKFLAPW